MNGDQAELAILGDAVLAGHMAAGGVINLALTKEPREPCEIEIALEGGEVHLSDSSDSGGTLGTQADALMMKASTGLQIILATRSNCRQEVNLAHTRVTEEILDAELHREGVQ